MYSIATSKFFWPILWSTYLPNGSQIILFGNAKSHKLSENDHIFLKNLLITIYLLPAKRIASFEKKGIDSCMKIRHRRHLTCGWHEFWYKRKHFIATGKMGWNFFWMSILIVMQLWRRRHKGETHKKADEHIWLHFFCFFWILSFFPLVPPWKLWKKKLC